jgi:uncharacterized membrane protein YhaH (DUF805 family)
MNWYLKVWTQYADFKGRARRKEYWMFVLFNIIFGIIANVVDYALGFGVEAGSIGIVSGIYTLAVLIPGIAVAVRRLHDVGKSGWMLLIILLPLIGFIWILVLMVTDGQEGANKWGNNPKEVEASLDGTIS